MCCVSWGRKGLDTTERLNWIGVKLYLTGVLIYIALTANDVERNFHVLIGHLYIFGTQLVCLPHHEWVSEWSHSVLSDSLWPHGLQPTRLLCPCDSPGKNTGVVVIPLSRESSQTKDRTWVSHIAGRFFTSWATVQFSSVQSLSQVRLCNPMNRSTPWKLLIMFH